MKREGLCLIFTSGVIVNYDTWVQRMTSWDEDYDDAITAFIEQSIKDKSTVNVRAYLGTYGDAIEARVDTCLDQARSLSKLGYQAAAVVIAVTALELMIRFMLVRPLVQGAFLSDEWAVILAERITSGRTLEDRKLLPVILRQWSVDLTAVRSSSGTLLWETMLSRVWPKRNEIVHEGAAASGEDAAISIECAECFRSQVVRVIAESLGFTLGRTGKWSEIRSEKGTFGKSGYRTWRQLFDPASPFDTANRSGIRPIANRGGGRRSRSR
jgi:hypothetical protein